MKFLKFITVLLVSYMLAGTLLAAEKKNSDNNLDVYIIASDDINEDVLGVASPVRISVLQLSTIVEFNQMNELSGTTSYKEHLGSSVVHEINIIVRPTTTLDFKLPLSETTEYIGIVVAYRDLSKNWKLALFKQDKKWYQNGANFLYLQVNADGVMALTKKQASKEIASIELKQKGENIDALNKRQQKKLLKKINKDLALKHSVDLDKGIFMEQASKIAQAGK